MQLIPKVFSYQMHQCGNLFRLKRLCMRAFQHVHNVLGPEQREMMPALQLCIYPARNRQNLVHGSYAASGAKRGRDQMFNDLCVEGVTRQPQTSIAQQVRRTSAPLANGRTNADKRKVAGAATEVANKNQLVMLERGFIKMGGGNRLQLELYRFVSGEMKCRLETGLGVDVISFFFRPDKMYGPANHSGSNRGSKLEFSFFAQVPQNAGDKIFKRNATPKDFSSRSEEHTSELQ